jgi:hypothetical protein
MRGRGSPRAKTKKPGQCPGFFWLDETAGLQGATLTKGIAVDFPARPALTPAISPLETEQNAQRRPVSLRAITMRWISLVPS